MAEVTKDHILGLFCEAAWEVSQKKFDNLDPTQKISAMGVDSVALLEIVGFLEDKLNVRLPDDKLARVDTLDDLSALILKLRPAA